MEWLKTNYHLREKSGLQSDSSYDVYGTIGIAFNNDVDKMVNYLLELENAAKPFKLRIEVL